MRFEEKLADLMEKLIDKYNDLKEKPRPPDGKIGITIARDSAESWMNDGIAIFEEREAALSDSLDSLLHANTDITHAMNRAMLANVTDVLPAMFELVPGRPSAAQIRQTIEHELTSPRRNKPTPIQLLSQMSLSHAMWESATERTALKHPNAALIETWLRKRPTPTTPNERPTGFAPAKLKNPCLFDISNFDRAPSADALLIPESQAWLPGLNPHPANPVPPLPFLIWDQNIGVKRGRATPYGLRLFVEFILSRSHTPQSGREEFTLNWGEIVDNTLDGRNNKDNISRLRDALHTVHNLRIIWGEPGALTARAPVVVSDIPATPDQYGANVRIVIDLPPGSDNGPLVYRPFLRKIARWKLPAYRAILTLSYIWDQHGSQKGQYIQPTIPRFYRDRAGHFLDQEDQTILKKNGEPITKYMTGKGYTRKLHPKVVPLTAQGERAATLDEAARDRNPAADRYPTLTPVDRVALCYPNAHIAGQPLSRSTPSKRKGRADKTLRDMAALKYLSIEETPDGWRILPPLGWGADFNSDE